MTVEERREWDRVRKATTRANRTPEQRAVYVAYLRNWRKLNPGYCALRSRNPEVRVKRHEYERRPSRRSSRNSRQNAARAVLSAEKVAALNSYTRNWRKNNPERCKRPGRTRIEHQNPRLRLIKNLRSRLYGAVSRAYKSAGTRALLGCSVDQLLGHLEIQFKPGMSWENYGPGWHVDHIRPCASFDFSDPAQQLACFNWKNLQPLWAEENLVKGSKTSECKPLTRRNL